MALGASSGVECQQEARPHFLGGGRHGGAHKNLTPADITVHKVIE
jgi:hypothetical protein